MQAAFTPLHDNNESKLYSKIKKQVSARFRKNEIEQLRGDIKKLNLDNKIIVEFFSQEGYSILLNAATCSAKTDALAFLCETVPLEQLREKLRCNEGEILRSLLYAESSHERHGKYDLKDQEIQLERFTLLLKIDFEGVSEFMKRNATEDFVTEKIKINFQNAVQLYQNSKSNQNKLSGK